MTRPKGFYASMFDWGMQQMGEWDYTLVHTTPIDETTQMPTEPGAINGGLMRRVAEIPAPVITIQVDSIDQALGKIEAAGGSTVRPRVEMGGMGASAYFKDPEGNVIGLWETARAPSPD